MVKQAADVELNIYWIPNLDTYKLPELQHARHLSEFHLNCR